MPRIIGLDGMTRDELNAELALGARFVVYHYCISIFIMSIRQGSEIHFIRARKSARVRGLRFSAISMLIGWWGLPWGPVFTVQSLWTNLCGGKDVTDAVIRSLNKSGYSGDIASRPPALAA